MALTNILSAKGFNLGGISSLKLAPIEWIVNLPTDGAIMDQINYELTFISGRGWVTITPEHESTECVFMGKTARGGDFHEMKLDTTVNRLHLESLSALRAAGFYRHALMITDNNGIRIVVGNKYQGCKLLHDTIINPSAEGKTFFKVTLMYESEFGPLFYPIP